MSAIQRFETAMVTSLRKALSSSKGVMVPPGGDLFWQWFNDLNATRSWHMNGPNPISHVEMQAYSRLTGWNLEAHHIAVLRAMDAAFIAYFYAKRDKGQNGDKKPALFSTKDMTPALFDAVFG